MTHFARISLQVVRSIPLRTILFVALCLSIGGGVAKATPPIDIFRLADATNAAQLAKVDAAGNVAVAVSNLPATQNVSVANFPATQQIAGSVGDARVTNQIGLDDLTLSGPLAVSSNHTTGGYTQARVNARLQLSSVSCATPLTIRVFTKAWITSNTYYPMQLGEGTICSTDDYSAVFDVPGTDIYYSVSGTAGARVIIATWGR